MKVHSTTAVPIDAERQQQIRRRKREKRKYTLTLLMMTLPGMVCLILFSYLPMFGIVIAFKNYVPLKGVFASEWVGFKNFEFFFTSQSAWRTIRNTVLYSIDFLVLDLVLGVLIAILLYNLTSSRALKTYHTIILLPRFLSIIIISFITYAMLSPSYGVVNQLVRAMGGNTVQWYSEAKYWPWIITIVHCWMSIGAGCLYYYAALTGIDASLFEAATIDGATCWQKAWYIMIPSLVPIMVIMTILGIGGLFSGDMGLFYQVPKDQGLLYETTDIINTYTYRALLGGSLAKSAAVGLFQSVVGLFLVLGTNTIVRKVSPEHSMF